MVDPTKRWWRSSSVPNADPILESALSSLLSQLALTCTEEKSYRCYWHIVTHFQTIFVSQVTLSSIFRLLSDHIVHIVAQQLHVHFICSLLRRRKGTGEIIAHFQTTYQNLLLSKLWDLYGGKFGQFGKALSFNRAYRLLLCSYKWQTFYEYNST